MPDDYSDLNPSAQLNEIDRILFNHPSVAMRMCKALLQAARQASDIETLVRAATQLSLIEDQLGERGEAGVVLAEALTCCQLYGLTELEPAVLERLGRNSYTTGDYPHALECWARCARLCGTSPAFTETRTLALVGLGHVCSAYGALDKAVAFHRAAERLLPALDDAYLTAKVKISLGWDLQATGHYDEAIVILRSALALCQAKHFGHYQAELVFRLAEIALGQGHIDEAERLLEDALELLVITPSHWSEANVLGLLAEVRAAQGLPDMAMSFALRALHIAEADGMRHVAARLHASMVHYALAAGQPGLAGNHRVRQETLQNLINNDTPPRDMPDWASLDDVLGG
ncbi:tetratricopeptide repeat protein [Andreprevotia chitinilytica]|uniref:tetratricopeptide repeat protein n=1 Tax=Andreprevotia chitinilytica TaxID=396808 RepID=UPI0005581349|nr:tetratricopeptide repeat protein [Andreprevotia chitinilytica]